MLPFFKFSKIQDNLLSFPLLILHDGKYYQDSTIWQELLKINSGGKLFRPAWNLRRI